MTTLQINTDNENKISELISSRIDDKLKKAKSTNTQKAEELKNTIK